MSRRKLPGWRGGHATETLPLAVGGGTDSVSTELPSLLSSSYFFPLAYGCPNESLAIASPEILHAPEFGVHDLVTVTGGAELVGVSLKDGITGLQLCCLLSLPSSVIALSLCRCLCHLVPPLSRYTHIGPLRYGCIDEALFLKSRREDALGEGGPRASKTAELFV